MVVFNSGSISSYLCAKRKAWYLLDANNQGCGRLAQYIAVILQGKTKPIFHRASDDGDYLVVINCKNIHFVGEKWYRKIYHHYTGMPGGMMEKFASELAMKDSCRIIWRAVDGMLPDNNLKRKRLSRLFLFDGKDHPFINNHIIPITSPQPLAPRITQFTKETLKDYPLIIKHKS